MKNKLPLFLFVFALLLAGCESAPAGGKGLSDAEAPVSSEPAGNPKDNGRELPMLTVEAPELIAGGNAMVDTLGVMMLEKTPVQVIVTVSGSLPDSCTSIKDIIAERKANIFELTLTTQRPAEMMCAQVLTPFEEKLALDVRELAAGTYLVAAGNQHVSFDLKAVNESNPAPSGGG